MGSIGSNSHRTTDAQNAGHPLCSQLVLDPMSGFSMLFLAFPHVLTPCCMVGVCGQAPGSPAEAHSALWGAARRDGGCRDSCVAPWHPPWAPVEGSGMETWVLSALVPPRRSLNQFVGGAEAIAMGYRCVVWIFPFSVSPQPGGQPWCGFNHSSKAAVPAPCSLPKEVV